MVEAPQIQRLVSHPGAESYEWVLVIALRPIRVVPRKFEYEPSSLVQESV